MKQYYGKKEKSKEESSKKKKSCQKKKTGKKEKSKKGEEEKIDKLAITMHRCGDRELITLSSKNKKLPSVEGSFLIFRK